MKSITISLCVPANDCLGGPLSGRGWQANKANIAIRRFIIVAEVGVEPTEPQIQSLGTSADIVTLQ